LLYKNFGPILDYFTAMVARFQEISALLSQHSTRAGSEISNAGLSEQKGQRGLSFWQIN
jgi:hypothetical protein